MVGAAHNLSFSVETDAVLSTRPGNVCAASDVSMRDGSKFTVNRFPRSCGLGSIKLTLESRSGPLPPRHNQNMSAKCE